jgi:hypothetical protein
LDWAKDTGMSQHKLVTIWAPSDGAHAHVTLGWAGVHGSIAGMSSQALTAHEANLEENEITFQGFPWTLRLRYIMENAASMKEALALWRATNNTCGFNFMVASGGDAAKGLKNPATCMETMFNYTAYFDADSPVENDAYYTQKDGKRTKIGFPMPEAVWRTNNGFDPTIRKHFEWSQSPTSWSEDRYLFIERAFKRYESIGQRVSDAEAINVTAIAGDKGHARQDVYKCSGTNAGTNVLSVTFVPKAQYLYVSWENGTKEAWRPAGCNVYIRLDLAKLW